MNESNQGQVKLAGAQANSASLDEQLAELEIERSEIEREGMALMLGLTVDSLRVALEAEAELSALSAASIEWGNRAATVATGSDCRAQRMGDPTPLLGKDWVTLKHAEEYLGVTRRAIEKAANKGTLTAQGSHGKRRISVESLLKYLPPKQFANQRELVRTNANTTA